MEKNGVKVQKCFTSYTDIMKTHMSLKMIEQAGHVLSVPATTSAPALGGAESLPPQRIQIFRQVWT